MNYSESFRQIERQCRSGSSLDIDAVMKTLNSADLPTTRAVNFYLFFARRNDWALINTAYSAGLIDYIHAFAR